MLKGKIVCEEKCCMVLVTLAVLDDKKDLAENLRGSRGTTKRVEISPSSVPESKILTHLVIRYLPIFSNLIPDINNPSNLFSTNKK